MGCRAILSPYYERGGFEPADENDTPVFVGRFNLGAISLNLPSANCPSSTKDFPLYNSCNSFKAVIPKERVADSRSGSIHSLGFK